MRSLCLLFFFFIVAVLPRIHAEYEVLLLVEQGDLAPGTEDLTFKRFENRGQYLDNAGNAWLYSQLSNDKYGFWRYSRTSSEIVFVELEPRPELGGHTLLDVLPYPSNQATTIFHNDFFLMSNRPDLLAFQGGQFAPIPNDRTPGVNTSYTSKVTANGDKALILGNEQGTFVWIATKDSKTEFLGKSDSLPGNDGQLFSKGLLTHPALSEDGYFAFYGGGQNRQQRVDPVFADMIVKGDPTGELKAVVVNNSGLFGAIVIEKLRISKGGTVAFKGLLPPNSDVAIYIEREDRGMRQVAEVSEVAPGTGLAKFSKLENFQISSSGQVTFYAADQSGANGIWTEALIDPEANTRSLRLMVREGDAPDGLGTFNRITESMAGDSGEVLFYAERTLSDQTTERAFWLVRLNPTTFDPEFERLFRFDQPDIQLTDGLVATASTFHSFGFRLNSGQDSRPEPMGVINNDGDIVLGLTYTAPGDSTPKEGIFLFSEKGILVNTLSDKGDLSIGDGVGDTGEPKIDGKPASSLRAAIQEANARGSKTRIHFDVDPAQAVNGEYIIRPDAPLPIITVPIIIDGLTQSVADPQSPHIILDGAQASATGLTIHSNQAVVTGMEIRNFEGDGIFHIGGDLTLTDVSILDCGNRGIYGEHVTMGVSFPTLQWDISNNGNHGLDARGNVKIDQYTFFNNQGYGIVTEGSTLNINTIYQSRRSISRNKLGGIRSTAIVFNAGELSFVENGWGADPLKGHGLDTPSATVDLFEPIASGNHGDGLVFKGGIIDGTESASRENLGSGIRVTGDLETEQLDIRQNKTFGIHSTGNLLSVNYEGSGVSRINDNKRAGIWATAKELKLGRTEVNNNGDPLSSRRDGHGIFAPNAAAVFEDDVKVSGNSENGVTVKSLLLEGPSSYTRNNMGTGLIVYGDLIAVSSFESTGNGDWGILAGGNRMVINSDLGTRTSQISNNKEGGILFTGTLFEATLLQIVNNGSELEPNGGLDASNSVVSLDDFQISGNFGDGIQAASAIIDSGRLIDNTGNGILLCPGPIVLEDVFVARNGESGVYICELPADDPSKVEGTVFEDNEDAAITSESDSDIDIESSQFLGGGKFAVNNLSTGNINASGNYWGDEIGPDGKVNGAVTYTNWETEPGDPRLEELLEVYSVLPGTELIIRLGIRFGKLNGKLLVDIAESNGWYAGEKGIRLDNTPGENNLTLRYIIPEDTAPDSESTTDLTLQIEEEGGSLRTVGMSGFKIRVYQPELMDVRITPPVMELLPGQQVQLMAEALDQYGNSFPYDPTWFAVSGGSIDQNGIFTAAVEAGAYEIRAGNLITFGVLTGNLVNTLIASVALPRDQYTDELFAIVWKPVGGGLFRLQASNDLATWVTLEEVVTGTTPAWLYLTYNYKFYRFVPILVE